MTFALNTIQDRDGARQNRKRVGRGVGSGTGKTAGSGQKGQKARTGVSINGFEGGQMPLYRRLPKRGFFNIFKKRYNEVNLKDLQAAVDAKKLDVKKPVTEDALKAAGLISKLQDGTRILGNGELKAKLDITVAGASKSAIAAIEKAGGKITTTAKVNKVVKAERKAAHEAAKAKRAAARG